tara:strand:+ start:1348 stop:2376 length:1029 start_codon:yes stop_codon:yes gene_type:complete
MKILSLFSGCGGMDLGFKQLNFETILATDKSKIACETLNINKMSNNILDEDIQKLNFENYKDKIDGVIGGPPCQPYSQTRHYIIGKKKGFEDVENGKTVNEFFRCIYEVRPKFFLFENVDGFMHKTHKKELNFLKKISKKLGYSINYKILNCANYGIPQTRKRFICVGFKSKTKKFEFPKETHINPEHENPNNLKYWKTCEEVISIYEKLDFLEKNIKVKPGGKDYELLKKIPSGDNYLFFTKKRGHKNPLFNWKSRYWTFLLKLTPTRPAWTIQASFSTNQGPFHWKNRFLNICEIQELQTINSDYQIVGDFKEKWKQIGNAFPTKMSKILAKSIHKQMIN